MSDNQEVATNKESMYSSDIKYSLSDKASIIQ